MIMGVPSSHFPKTGILDFKRESPTSAITSVIITRKARVSE
jgi:hypothetical protein